VICRARPAAFALPRPLIYTPVYPESGRVLESL
jgi:hypothetical protein